MSQSVRFVENARPDRKDLGWLGEGTIVRSADGIVLTAHVDRRGVGCVGGVLGFGGGLALVITVFLVAQHFGWDIFRIRRGATLVAMLSLGAGMAGATGLTSALAWLVGKRSTRLLIPHGAIEGIAAQNGIVGIAYTRQGAPMWVAVHAANAEALAAELRGDV